MKTYILKLTLLFTVLLGGCTKEFLDKKPTKSAVVPSKLSDYRSLLDNPSVMITNSSPGMGFIASDDFETPDAVVKTLLVHEKGAYLWDKNMEGYSGDWLFPYTQIFYCNVVLEGLDDLGAPARELNEYRHIKGTAIFIRSFAFFNLLEHFTRPYNPATAGSDPGVPLRLTSDVNIRPGRGSTAQVYDQVIQDLRLALELLPAEQTYKSRPAKISALALLARIHLVMSRFKEAGDYANESLKLQSTLVNYESLNKDAPRPFPLALPNGNSEILYYSSLATSVYAISALTRLNPSLYAQYQQGDLRKVLYFADKGAGLVTFKGSYTGDNSLFSGLATDELLLIKAECYAREGKTQEAMAVLNGLLAQRWDGSFKPLTADNREQALKIILQERRKELVGRGLRFSDLRRLNKEPEHAEQLKRIYEGVTYLLPPGDPRYVFPIPVKEITLTGIAQNER